MCVTYQALVSALVRRIRDGYRVSPEDVSTLLRSGVSVDELVRAFSEEGEPFAHARTVLDEVGIAV